MSDSTWSMRWVVVAGVALAVANFGCATVVAGGIPGPVADDSIELGMHRSEVESVLANAKRVEYSESKGSSVRYEYRSGPHQASKARVVLYVAGDVFSLFLSELVFWPIELYASSEAQRFASAYFDSGNRLQMWILSRGGDRELVATLGKRPDLEEKAASFEEKKSRGLGNEPEDDVAEESSGG